MGLLKGPWNQYSPLACFCSPHAGKVPFCYVQEQCRTVENADQSGEKETFNIGL
jgi:hypothetical protein